MSERPIGVFRPMFPPTSKIAGYIDESMRTGLFSNGGPLVVRLEQRLAEHFGVPPSQVAMCSSGTTALEGALAVSGDIASAWSLPSWTFTATPGALLRAGKHAKFVDVGPSQRSVFDPSTSFAVDVLPFGAGPDWDRQGAPKGTVLVDAAASFDGCKNFPFSNLNRVGVIVSLHATKSLPAGEGGVFFSNDEQWVADFRRWANFGMWGSRVSQVAGTNAKMSELTAAVGLASLDMWDTTRQQWLDLAYAAGEISTELNVSLSRSGSHHFASPYWNIQLESATARRGLERHLADHGVETRRWWGDGCHSMPAYAGIPRDQLPQTEKFADTILGLPFHLNLTTSDLEHIRDLTSEYFKRPPTDDHLSY